MKFAFFVVLLTWAAIATAQTDTTQKLNIVEVKGYHNRQPLFRSVSAVTLLDSTAAKHQSGLTLVGLMNTIPGVRMEERSPGSYRLSLRGSLLRSPFGIRNIKIYLDDFPLTDASGNSYLNLIEPGALGNIEVYKGPDASSFGANTGGVVLLSTALPLRNETKLSANAGSYGLFQQSAAINRNFGNYQFNLTEGYQRSDGYRENSALNRKYIHLNQRYQYSPNGDVKAFIFYSNLTYQTPGGLTESQFTASPKIARPATATLPGASAQQAAIYNETIFGGLSHTYLLTKKLKHFIALFGSVTDFKNPFITNYEKRNEQNLGLRSFLAFDESWLQNRIGVALGVETATASAAVTNYANNLGKPDALLASDDLTSNLTFAFLKINMSLAQRLSVEMGTSVNYFNYDYRSIAPLANQKQTRKFSAALMPKFAISYVLDPLLVIRASASKGYSPPTIAEVRASDQQVNVNLLPEQGWNYETGFRISAANQRLFVDGSIFYFNLKNTIVRRLNTNETEYFVNAGGTKQFGTELQLNYRLLKQPIGFLNQLTSQNSFTYSHFRFATVVGSGNSFAGNKLTGVPQQNWVAALVFEFRGSLSLYAQYNEVSTLPLNDANTAYADGYQLVDVKIGKDNISLFGMRLSLAGGFNNLLNQKYSLGNDLNAIGGRYYNAAAGRNIYVGANVKF